jgi:beta-lactamase class D
MRIILTFVLLSFTAFSFAKACDPDYNHEFAGSNACFILYNPATKMEIARYNPEDCAKRRSPASTFKIPLALMGFDAKILQDENHPKWEYKPRSWMKHSVVWYSQVLTPQLEMPIIKKYLAQFNYGNQNMSSGVRGRTGLNGAWISGSLLISPNEQLEFLKKLVTDTLPVSAHAIVMTKNILDSEDLEHGWKLYGKTGAYDLDVTKEDSLQGGWYVGWINKGQQSYIFVIHQEDQQKFPIGPSKRAKALLLDLGLLK